MPVSLFHSLLIGFVLLLSVASSFSQISHSPKFVSSIVAGFDHSSTRVSSPLLSSLRSPERIFISPSNELFIADRSNNVIKKVSQTGVTQVVAGNGKTGFSGDGKLATSETVESPRSIFVTQQNEILIADSGNHRIRKVDTSGVINTLVFNNTEYVSPHTVSYSSLFGIVFLERNMLRGFKDGRVYNLAGIKTQYLYNGDGYGPNCTLYEPSDIFVESNGEILIVDKGNKRIRRLKSDQTLVTIAGGSSEYYDKENIKENDFALNATLSDLGYITSSSSGIIFFTQGHAVRKLQNEFLSTIVGSVNTAGMDGLLLSSPRGLAISSNNLHIAVGNLVKTFDLVNGGQLKVVAGIDWNSFSGDGSDAKTVPLGRVWGVHVTPEKEVYFTETSRNKIRKVDLNGKLSTIAGFSGISGYSGENISSLKSLINQPTGIYVNAEKEVFFAEPFNYKIRKINSNANITTLAGDSQTTPYQNSASPLKTKIFEASGFSVSNDTMLIADLNHNMIRQVSFKANLIVTIAGKISMFPENKDNVTASDQTVLNNPSSIALSKTSGDIFFTDNSGVKKLSAKTGYITIVAGYNSEPSFNGDLKNSSVSFNFPRGLFIDNNGKQEILYIADTVNKRVRRIFVSDNGLSKVETLFEDIVPITGIFVQNNDIYTAGGNLIKKYAITCSTNSELSSDKTTCNCLKGYSVSSNNECSVYDCFGERFDSPNACSGNGACISPDTCSCTGNWNGTKCERVILSGASSLSIQPLLLFLVSALFLILSGY